MPAPAAPAPSSPYDAEAFVRAACAAAGEAMEDAAVSGARLRTMRRRRGPFTLLGPPPVAFYHAPAVDAWPAEAAPHDGALVDLLGHLQARAHAVALSLPPLADGALPDVRALTGRGFRCEVRYTYRLRVDAPEPVRAAMSASARRALAGAPQPLLPATGRALAAAVDGAYRRHGRRPPLSPDRLATLADTCAAEGVGRLVQVDAAVALVLGLDGDASAGGTAPCLALNGGSGLPGLVWAIAAEARTRGHRWLDLVGANTASIAEAKRRLGAVLVPYVRATWHRPGLARALSGVRPLV